MAFNTKNFNVVWPATSATSLFNGNLDVAYLNKSIPLINGIPITNPRTGILSYNYNLPANNLRHITFSSVVPGVVFQVTGIVSTYPTYNSPAQTSIVTENVTCTLTVTSYPTVNIYSKILSIVPITMAASSVVLIGYSTGTTVPFYADVWNNVNNYSVAFTNVVSQSLTLGYSLDDTNYFSANITQPPFVVSPTGLVNPITVNGIVSFISIPLTSINIAATGIGTFTATIMQQGATY